MHTLNNVNLSEGKLFSEEENIDKNFDLHNILTVSRTYIKFRGIHKVKYPQTMIVPCQMFENADRLTNNHSPKPQWICKKNSNGTYHVKRKKL